MTFSIRMTLASPGIDKQGEGAPTFYNNLYTAKVASGGYLKFQMVHSRAYYAPNMGGFFVFGSVNDGGVSGSATE